MDSSTRDEQYRRALDEAARSALNWLRSAPGRRVPAPAGPAEVAAHLEGGVPAAGSSPEAVLRRLAAVVEPGLMASGSGTFFGWVMGGTLPAALGADWLVSAWDQNSGMRDATPGTVVVEETAARWLLELLGLPDTAAVGFATGATMANFTCLAAARDTVLGGAGWSIGVALADAPRVRVLVGRERHSSIDLVLRYLGLGAPEEVAVDSQGRLDVQDLRLRLGGGGGPTILCLQAGNIHSGAFDPFVEAIEVAHGVGAWVHVDGAFGLWAAASSRSGELTSGLSDADSWATDAHKTLNTPYDGGIAIVAEREAVRAAMGSHASYLLTSSAVDQHELVPELSRRARGVPVWAAIASLGASGVRELVDGLMASAQDIARRIVDVPGARVVNDVVYTQVSVAFETDERTRQVLRRILAEGAIMPSGSEWHGAAVIRFSVSSWLTDDDAVARTIAAVRRAAV